MKLDVPYYSQWRDVKDKGWQKRSCSIVCLKMVLEYCKNQRVDCDSPVIENLIKEGIFVKGLDENRNWKQDAIVFLLHNHGVNAYRQEFKSFKVDIKNKKENESVYAGMMLKEGIKKIASELNAKNPVLVSVAKKFSEENNFHLVVLIGLEQEKGEVKGFYYNDPDYQEEDTNPPKADGQGGKELFVDRETFGKYWRKMAIFMHKIA